MAVKSIKRAYQIPFDKDGNLAHSLWQWGLTGLEWRDNYIIDDGMAVIDLGTLVSVNDGYRYNIFQTDLLKAFAVCTPSRVLVDGKMRLVLTGHWNFIKRGTNYGIVPYVPD